MEEPPEHPEDENTLAWMWPDFQKEDPMLAELTRAVRAKGMPEMPADAENDQERYLEGFPSMQVEKGLLMSIPRSLGMLMRSNIGPQMASEDELASRREVWSMNTGGQGPAGAPKTQHLVPGPGSPWEGEGVVPEANPGQSGIWHSLPVCARGGFL